MFNLFYTCKLWATYQVHHVGSHEAKILSHSDLIGYKYNMNIEAKVAIQEIWKNYCLTKLRETDITKKICSAVANKIS